MMSTTEPGWILPATPVSASTMIAISRWPAASCGGASSMPFWSTVSDGRSVAETRFTSSPRSVIALRGAQRRGSVMVLIASSLTPSWALTDLESASTSIFGSTCARTSAT